MSNSEREWSQDVYIKTLEEDRKEWKRIMADKNVPEKYCQRVTKIIIKHIIINKII